MSIQPPLLFPLLIAFVLMLAPALPLSARIFTDVDGKTIEAELLSIEGDNVRFKRTIDGKVFTSPISQFSLKDRSFILHEQSAGRLNMMAYTGVNLPTVAPVVKSPQHANASRQIDRILESYWQQAGVEPEAIVDDATYLRRAYLKIIGRIPTYAEAVHFLNQTGPDKRSELVDKLLDSSGYVSHQFNLWADVLRVRTVGREGSRYGGIYYAQWLKDQIRQNVPYDEFVASLVSAEGYPWDNPAAAYYLRDFGMPLDNMSMTAQIFLGTQLQCAQCHNHPTDKWTQKDFYEMSAFTYGLRTGINIQNASTELKTIMRQLREIDRRENGGEAVKRNQGNATSAARSFFEPLRWGVAHDERNLKLPDDYQYDDAAPRDVVNAHVIFGDVDSAKLNDSAARVESYAKWMVSENNERFTKVVANRLWKHAMGKGLIEPVDDLNDGSVADSPELMAFLETLMKRVDYDLKQYLRVLYNTEYFQRAAVLDNPDLDDDYHLEGPIFARMTSEQIWDSIATLMTPDIDRILQPSYQSGSNGITYRSNERPAAAVFLEEKSSREVVEYIEKMAESYQRYIALRTEWNTIRNDPDLRGSKEYMATRTKYQVADKEWKAFLNPKSLDGDADAPMGMSMMMSNMAMLSGPDQKAQRKDEKWMKGIRRASELQSPQANGHLLEVFGQSDRQLIENADDGSNVLQALFLMNSWQTNDLLANKSAPVIEARLAKTAEAKIETLYLGFLSRKPTQAEQDALIDYFKKDPEKARQRIIWAMLNTQQFLFIQ